MPVTPATIAAANPPTPHVIKGSLGTLTAAPATTSSTSSTPFGYSQAQADAILALVIEMRAVLVSAGLVV